VFCVYRVYAEQRIFNMLVKNFFLFKIIYDPLIFANKRFSKIQSINSDRAGFKSQSCVKSSKLT
jgi:hypothetical protein